MKILKLSDLWQNFMKNDNIFDIICEEGSKNQIWWRGRIERFSDSDHTYIEPNPQIWCTHLAWPCCTAVHVNCTLVL